MTSNESGGDSFRNLTGKNEHFIEWEDYFMGVALLASMRSKDPRTQVGACVVNDENKIVGVGYNGFPKGCSDDRFSWRRKKETCDPLYDKKLYVCHAEVNALLNRNCCSTKNCKMYVTLFPCNECVKFIIQTGIKEIFYLEKKGKNDCYEKAAVSMLEASGVKYSKFVSGNEKFISSLCDIKEDLKEGPVCKKSRLQGEEETSE